MKAKINIDERNRLIRTMECGVGRYYVYALCDGNNVPFYIGKGERDRVLQHGDAALLAKEAIDADDTLSKKAKEQKIRELTDKLRVILREGSDIKEVVVKWGLTQSEAFMCESALINMLEWCQGLKVAPLTNLVNGHASEKEREMSRSGKKTQARSVEQFLFDCGLEKREIGELDNFNVAFIKINKYYKCCLNMDGSLDDDKVRETVRGLWYFPGRRFEKVEYIFALYNLRVVGIYHVAQKPRRLADERNDGLPDFPAAPTEVRRRDRIKSLYATLSEAKRLLPQADYEEMVLDFLENQSDCTESTLLKRFKSFQKRVYFHVDNKVPESVRKFFNCIPVRNASTDFLTTKRALLDPVVLNFK